MFRGAVEYRNNINTNRRRTENQSKAGSVMNEKPVAGEGSSPGANSGTGPQPGTGTETGPQQINNDMTRGNVFRTLLSFAIPLIITGLLQQMYYIADSVIVGNLLGEEALAAVGVNTPILNVFIFIITGLVSGYTLLLSHFYGAREYQKIARLSNTFLMITLVLVGVIAILGFFLKQNILALLNTPAEILKPAGDYLAIVFCGLPLMVLYNLFGSMLRSIGDSKTPLFAIVLSTAINILLDLTFIGVLNWGIRGAAIATIISQAVSCLYLFLSIYRDHPFFMIIFRKDQWDWRLFCEGFRLGLPRVLQSSVASIGSVLLQNIMNSFGVNVVTAIVTAYRIDSLTILPVLNMSAAISIFTGQNIGAHNMERAKEGLRKGITILLIVSVAITTFVVLAGRILMKAFGVSDEIAALGQHFFGICAIFYPVLGLQQAYLGFLQGNKDVVFAAVAGLLMLAVRVATSYLLAGFGLPGIEVIALSEMAGWTLGTVICFVRYRRKEWSYRNPANGGDEKQEYMAG